MFYALPYRVLFHDTMAYGTQHFLTNFKLQCEAREHLLFSRLESCSSEQRRKFQDILFLTLNAFSRNMDSVSVGGRVGILLSVEDLAPSSARFCFRVIGEQGQPVACGFQTIAMLSRQTQQLVAFPELTQGQHVLRERLCRPDFQTRVLAGDTSSLFPKHVVEVGKRIAQLPQASAVPQFVPSTSWETDHSGIWQSGLRGKAFLFPGTGSLAWSRLSSILASAAFSELLAQVDEPVRAKLGYGTLALAACRSSDDFADLARRCSGIDQICNYLVSVQFAMLLSERGKTPDVIVGHSAGELSALAVGGAYSLQQGLDIVCKRIAALQPQRNAGGMLILSAHQRRVESLLQSLVSPHLQISVINHQDQVGVSGPVDELARLRDLASHLRIPQVLLPSEYPFHCKVLAPAVERFAQLLGDAQLDCPTVPVYSPLERDFYGPGKAADILPFHFVRPLDYWSGIAQMYDLGIRTFVDCSTGATLKGIADRVLSSKGDAVVNAALDFDLLGKPRRKVIPVLAAAQPADARLSPPDDREIEGEVPIAIVGLGCVIPGAQNPDQLWENIRNGTNSFVDLAELSPMDAQDFLSPGDIAPDKTYSLVSGVVDDSGRAVQLDTRDDPSLAERILKSAVRQAAGSLSRSEEARIELLIGSTADGYADLDEAVLAAEAEEVARHLPTPEHNADLLRALRRVLVRRPESASSLTAPAVLSNVAREVLGPRTSALAIDAACASSLYSIELGIQKLRHQATDVAICGGVYIAGPATWCLFAQFGGLSTKGPPRPFDAAADGVVFCPGAAVVALKRLPDALRDNDEIQAVIRGCGISSDGKGASVIEPKKEGQVLAIRRAYSTARIGVETVQYVEAHATATRVGDAVEFAALNEVFKGVPGTIAVSSLKAIIGHTGWAAGAASVIKVCRALQHKTIPLNANFSRPSPDLDITGSPLVIPSSCLSWVRGKTPRRAGVNGFGFGGANGHAIIEEYDPDYHSAWRQDVRPSHAAHNGDIVVVGIGVVRPHDSALEIDERNLKLPQRRRILPDLLECLDRSQIMAIMAADQSLGCLGSRWPEWREHIGVILGFEAKTANSGKMAGRLYIDRIKRRLAQALSEQGYSAAEQRALVEQFARALCDKAAPAGRYTLQGVIANLAAGRISNLFDLRGANFVVDDAGASLLQAIRVASLQLQRGTCKIVLTGGISANSSPAAQHMTLEQYRRGRPIGETALVLALTRADFAKAESLQPIATLAIDADSEGAAEEFRVGQGPAYLMGAEGAREIEAALARIAQDKAASIVRWPIRNGAAGGIRFGNPRALAPAVAAAPFAEAPAIGDSRAIDYCTLEFKPAPRVPAAPRVDLRHSKVLLICDQPSLLDTMDFPHWICAAPAGLRIPHAHPLDLASEAELLRSCNNLRFSDLDAVIAIKDLATAPLEMPGGTGDTAFDLSVAIARLLYAQIKQGRTQFSVLCCGAWGERALHPVTGLFGGMIKSLARELPDSRCKAVYSDERMGQAALQQLYAESDTGDDAPEVAYRNGVRHVLRLVRAAADLPDVDALGLDEESVVLATGGGRGITAKMVEAILERYRCSVVVLGRLDPNELPSGLRGNDQQALDAMERTFYQTGLRDKPGITVKQLKQRFEHWRACHEVQANLDHFRSFGARVDYLPVDITNAGGVDAAIATVRRQHGRLDLVIHGAGIQESRPFDTKSLLDFRRVVSTKVDGLANLRRACERQFPGSSIHYHLVTSTFSVLGNDGQADYGAANEMLNRTAQWRSSMGEPWSALAWLGWDGVGMARGPEFKRLGERRGLRGIQPEEGKKLFMTFLTSRRLKPVVALISPGESKFYKAPIAAAQDAAPAIGKLNGARKPANGTRVTEDKWRVSLATHPSMVDHMVGGRPTLPWVFAIDFGVRSALAQKKDFDGIAVSDLRFDRYIAMRDSQGFELNARTQLVSETDQESEFRVELRSDFVHSSGIVLNRDILHYSGNVHLMKYPNIDQLPRCIPEATSTSTVPDPYLDSQSPLRVRGVFHCMQDIRISNGVRWASFHTNGDKLPPEFLNSSIPCLLLDALGRMSCLVRDESGKVPICVPVRGERIWIAPGVNDRTVLGTAITLRAGGLPRIEGDMMFSDTFAEAIMPDGRVILRLEDFVCKVLGAVKV